MKDQLKDKIENTLRKTQKEESDIVYLMVKIRKYLEKDKNKGSRYKILKSYCDWSLHDKITNNKTCQNILKETEQEYKETKGIDPVFMHKILGLDILKLELGSFFQSIDIKNIFSNDEEWIHFRKLFIDNLSDCPIEPRDKTGLIEKFLFLKSNNYDINFQIKLFNKKTPIYGTISERFIELEGKK